MDELGDLFTGSRYTQSLIEMRDNVASRRIRQGFEHLESLAAEFASCRAEEPGAGVLLGYLAQWVDIGFARRELVRELLGRFPASRRQKLSILDYAHVLMAEGLVLMSEEDYGRAREQFAVVLALQNDLEDK